MKISKSEKIKHDYHIEYLFTKFQLEIRKLSDT